MGLNAISAGHSDLVFYFKSVPEHASLTPQASSHLAITLRIRNAGTFLPTGAVAQEGRDQEFRPAPYSQDPAPRPAHTCYSRNARPPLQAQPPAPPPPGCRPLPELTERGLGHLSLGRVPQFLGLGCLCLPGPLRRGPGRLGRACRGPGGCRGRERGTDRVGGRAGSPSPQGQARLGQSRNLWNLPRRPFRPSARAARPRPGPPHPPAPLAAPSRAAAGRPT